MGGQIKGRTNEGTNGLTLFTPLRQCHSRRDKDCITPPQMRLITRFICLIRDEEQQVIENFHKKFCTLEAGGAKLQW